MPCKTCGQTDHSRSSSSKCKFFLPRFSKTIPKTNDVSTYVKSDFGFTIKARLRKIVKDNSILETIDILAQQLTIISYHATRLLNLHLLLLLETDNDIDINLNETFIRQFFSIVQRGVDNESFNSSIVETFQNHFNYNIPKIELLKGFSQVITIAVKDYKVNLDNHHDSIYWRNLRKYCKLQFFNFDETEKCIDFFEIKPTLEQIREQYPKFIMFHQSNLLTSIYKSSIEIASREKLVKILKKLVLERKISKFISRLDKKNPEGYRLSKKSVKQLKINFKQLLTFTNQLKQCKKMCSVVPLCSQSVKYITIDTNVLYVLLGSKTGTKLTLEKFANSENQVNMWRKTFKLKEKWMSYENDNFENKKLFNFRIATDGLSCSINFKKFKIRERVVKENIEEQPKITTNSFEKRTDKRKRHRDKQKEKKKRRKKDKEQEEIVEIVDQMMVDGEQTGISSSFMSAIENTNEIVTGIDPGASKILTCVTILKENGSKEDEIVKSFSNGEYHQRCLHKQRLQYVDNFMKRNDLKLWSSRIPTCRTLDSIKFSEYLNYIYNSNNGIANLELMQQFQLKWKTRLKRWGEYIEKQRTMYSICKEIVSTIPKEKEAVIAFGDASWSQRKGYSPSPRGKKFYLLLKERFSNDNLRVISTSEYNSSQICSKCKNFERLDECKEPFISNSYSVKNCPICLTVWNRDVNACRNLVTICKSVLNRGKKPTIFSNMLPKKKTMMETDDLHSDTE